LSILKTIRFSLRILRILEDLKRKTGKNRKVIIEEAIETYAKEKHDIQRNLCAFYEKTKNPNEVFCRKIGHTVSYEKCLTCKDWKD